MNPELPYWCGRVLSAAGTGIYQGLLLTAVIWVGLRLLPRTNAATRHAVAMAALVLVAGLPFLHLAGSMVEEGRTQVAEPSSASAGAPAVDNWEIDFEPLVEVEDSLPALESAWPEGVDVPFTASRASGDLPGSGEEFVLAVEPQTTAGEFVREEGVAGLSGPGGTEVEDGAAGFIRWPETPKSLGVALPGWAAVLLVGIWGVLGSMRLGNVAWQCWRLHLLKRNGSAATGVLEDRFQEILCEMEVGRGARLIISREISAPMAAGYFRPAVLLPSELAERANDSEMEALLRHEAAHLRRKDDWANLLQQLIRAIYFFHPGVWWLSRRLTLEREIACDDHVLAASGSRQAYALLLTEFAGRMQSSDWEAAPAAWSRKSQLKERIGMILDQKRNASTRLARSKVGLAVVAVTLMAAAGWQSAPRLVFAQEASAAASTTLIAEESVISAEGETPERSKPSRTGTTTLTAPGGSATAIISASAAPAVEARPAARASVTFAPAAPRLVEPEIALDIKAPVFAQAPPVAPTHPKPAPAPRKPEGDSLERRVERLERMIESLVGRQKENPLHFDHKLEFNMHGPDEGRSKEWEAHAQAWKEHEKQVEKRPGFGPNEKELQRIHQLATRRALEQAQRDADSAALLSKKLAQDAQGQKQHLEARRRALEQEKQALERQMERLEGMLEQIQREEESVEEQKERKFKRSGEESRNIPEKPLF